MEVEILKQFKPIFEREHRLYIYKGGRSSGKSWGIADTLLLLGRTCKERILCTREIQKSIETSSYQLLVDRINCHGYTDYEISKTSIKNKITGTEFIFAGLSDITGTADSLKSIENISICWCEEAQTISDKSFEKLTPSIRGKNSKGQGSIIIISYNPETVNDPVHIRFIASEYPKTHICHINYLDNPYCSQEIIEEAESMKKNKPDDYKRIWLGVPDDFSNRAVVKYFNNDNICDVNYLPDEDLILTMDFNVDPMMWCVCHKDENNLYQFDEIVIDNCTTQDAINEFINRYPHHKGNIILCGDASGNYRKTQSNQSDYVICRNALLKHGYEKVMQNTRPFNPPIQQRIKAFNKLIFDDNGERHYFVSQNCKWTLYNLRNLLYKVGTSIIDLPTPARIDADNDLKYLGHIFDAISYPAEYYWPITLNNKENKEVVNPDKYWTMEELIKRHRNEERSNKW